MAVLSAVSAKVWLFHLKSARGSLSSDVIREICLYFEDLFFARIYGRRMKLFDFSTQLASQHQLSTYTESGYIQVDRTTVLIVGVKVLTLNLLTFQTSPLACLRIPRDMVGVAQVGTTVFAFGGCGYGTVCEKCSFPPTHWTPLPSMHYARWFFTPCRFKALLYLASTAAIDHRVVESFNPHIETFTVLPVSLPSDLELGGGSVAFVANEELILLTYRKQMIRWKIEQEAHFRVSTSSRECCSYHPPLIVGAVVYIANHLTMEKWSLQAGSFI